MLNIPEKIEVQHKIEQNSAILLGLIVFLAVTLAVGCGVVIGTKLGR